MILHYMVSGCLSEPPLMAYRAWFLPGTHICCLTPDLDSFVLAACGEHLPRGIKGHRCDAVAVTAQRRDISPQLYVYRPFQNVGQPEQGTNEETKSRKRTQFMQDVQSSAKQSKTQPASKAQVMNTVISARVCEITRTRMPSPALCHLG
jgi:hypothetical protein